MGKDYEEIDEKIERWINRQHLFFVSTAPLSRDGLQEYKLEKNAQSLDGLDGLDLNSPD